MDQPARSITEGAWAMTTFHRWDDRWDDVKHEIFDEEDVAAVDENRYRIA
ncbi:hypothetical protein GCM10010517_50380 [Streptosporangium fragile]|uniref:Uncharacterized protein n=1 Tax=Streptosporangium fragile TaxID=46186 RepID=A0ABN3W2R8_9ACTN